MVRVRVRIRLMVRVRLRVRLGLGLGEEEPPMGWSVSVRVWPARAAQIFMCPTEPSPLDLPS